MIRACRLFLVVILAYRLFLTLCVQRQRQAGKYGHDSGLFCDALHVVTFPFLVTLRPIGTSLGCLLAPIVARDTLHCERYSYRKVH